jgi:ribosomal protein L14E/L6E/L27E
MGFSKFVEIGRVATINKGLNEGKLVVILDVLNLNRVLVEGADN